LAHGLDGLGNLTKLASAYREPSQFVQMAIAPLPPPTDARALKARLYGDYKIEIPVIEWGGKAYLRISVQGYNTVEDVGRLVEALQDLLKTDRLWA
jgi:selenocysteine lyase/cysteine desulfurase